MKQKGKKKEKITKGMPSAVLLSILIHAVLFLLAGMLVVFTVVKKKEVEFEPPKAVERPKMKLKKPKVRVKKTSRPKPTTRIVTKVNRANMPDIQLPEMSGMGGDGLGDVIGGFDMMPEIEDVTVFGSGRSIGNDFEGTFYDLKRDRSGRNIIMSKEKYFDTLVNFVKSGWKTSKLARFYRSPNKLYATSFMIPPTQSFFAPAAFGADDTDGWLWAAHYKGKLVHKDGIKFRFWGQGNDILLVRVGGKVVLSACWHGWPYERYANYHFKRFQESNDPQNRIYLMGDNKSVVGEWITLEPGVPLDMEVLIGEHPGGDFAAMLAVEVEGVEYERGPQGNPILPMFKTSEPSLDLVDAIFKDLIPGEVSVTNGPVFSDYEMAGWKGSAKQPEQPEPAVLDDFNEHETRTWTFANGRAMEAEFVNIFAGKIVLKDAKEKIYKVPKDRLSPSDVEYAELSTPPKFNIDFSKKSSQFQFKQSPYTSRTPRILDYTFGTKLKQTSAGQYNHELRIEFFTIGAERFGDRYILLDRQKSSFTPTKENQRTHEFYGSPVRTTAYEIFGYPPRGEKYASHLVVVSDARGKIIDFSAPKKWLYENVENLRKLPVGCYLDKTCTRVFPTRPESTRY